METTRVLRERAAQGDSDAQFRIGYRLAYHRDPRKRDWLAAFEAWRSAASQGHVRACFYLGTCFDFGQGATLDRRRAMCWYRAAAAVGHPLAAYNLAIGLRDGSGVRRDVRAAARWFARSAAAGEAEAMADLGYCLHEGLGIRRNAAAAARLYRRAARAGVLRAQFNLGLCYLHGDGVPQSNRNARVWLGKAAARRHRRARELLAAA